MNKKLISTLLSCMLISSMVAPVASCGTREQFGETVDTKKTQLFVSNYDGGFGTTWLNDLKTAFEAENANVSYEDGKMGVQIILDPNKDLGYASTFSIDTSNNELFFVERLPNTKIMEYVNQGKLMDLSDVMTGILNQDGVGLSADIQNSLKATGDGKYYAIPHYEGGGGITYDKKLFEDKVLYISEDGSYTNYQMGGLSAGPDGIAGTDDDGLPATIEEFVNLMAWMKQRNVTPFIISGQFKSGYMDFLLDRFKMAYDGYDSSRADFTFEGKQIEYVTKMTENPDALFGYDLETEKVDITNENAYLLKQTKGRYYALSVLETIIDNQYYSVKGWNSTTSHVDAQEMYMKSAGTSSPIAMLIEGVWWQNEASDVYTRMEAENEANSRANRQFGWMPIPTKLDANDTNTAGDTLLMSDSVYAYAIAKSNLSEGKAKLLKDFLAYCYTPAALEAYTVSTETTRPFTYSLSQENYNKLSSLGKQIWDTHKQGKFVYTHSDNMSYIWNEATLSNSKWGSTVSGDPITAMFSSKISAATYFQGMWSDANSWANLLAKVQ